MSSPDHVAAHLSDDGRYTAGQLTEDHLGAVLTVAGSTGALRFVHGLSDGQVFVSLQRDGDDRPIGLAVERTEPVDIVREAPLAEFVTIDPDEIRQLASVKDMLKAHKGVAADLEERQAKLQEKLLEAFISNGVQEIRVDGRLAYIGIPTFPAFLQREDGAFYDKTDVLPVLKALGYGSVIAAESINSNTFAKILRELVEQHGQLPEELAQMVELREYPEVRIGAPRKGCSR